MNRPRTEALPGRFHVYTEHMTDNYHFAADAHASGKEFESEAGGAVTV